MCLALPHKITKLQKNKAFCKYGDKNIEVDISLIKKPKINDFVLIYSNIAIKKLSEKEAVEILNTISSFKKEEVV